MIINNTKESLIKYIKKTFIEEDYSFIVSKERAEETIKDFETTKRSLRVYHNDKISNQINESWIECDLDVALNRIFNPMIPNEQENRAFLLPQNVLEKIWLQCKNQEEADFYIEHVLKPHTHINDLKLIDQLTNNTYKNLLITKYFKIDSKNRSAIDNSLHLLINFVKINKLTLTSENLEAMCLAEKSSLSQLSNQALFKDFIENYMPEQVSKYKSYWKKVDTSLVADQDFLIEQSCYAISFNKIQLYALAPTENTDFFQRRLQNLCTFLNKTATKKLIPLERIVFDGQQESQKHYHFIIFSPNKPTVKFKQFLQDLVVHNIEFNKVPDMNDLRKVINYMLLKEKAQSSPDIKKERTRKI